MLDIRIPDGMTGDVSQLGAQMGAQATANALRIVERLYDKRMTYAALGILGAYVGYVIFVGLHREFRVAPAVKHDVTHRGGVPGDSRP